MEIWKEKKRIQTNFLPKGKQTLQFSPRSDASAPSLLDFFKKNFRFLMFYFELTPYLNEKRRLEIYLNVPTTKRARDI
jgi:hypothetical protein